VSGGSGGVSDPADKLVRVWDLEAGKLLHTLTGHDGRVRSVAVSGDSRRMWDLAQGVEIASFVSGSQVHVVAVAPSGTRVAAGSEDGPVHLLELTGGDGAI
jgi:WD40 repeat protein